MCVYCLENTFFQCYDGCGIFFADDVDDLLKLLVLDCCCYYYCKFVVVGSPTFVDCKSYSSLTPVVPSYIKLVIEASESSCELPLLILLLTTE